MARKKDNRIELGAGDGRPEGALTHSPFAAWARASADAGSAAEANAGVTASEMRGDRADRASVEPARAEVCARLRHERKGHGGKTVTVIEFERHGATFDLAESARAIGKAVGTRARVVDDTIVVQGDVRDRLQRYLETTLAMRVRRAT